MLTTGRTLSTTVTSQHQRCKSRDSIATAGAPGTLTAEITTATGGPTAAQETTGTSGDSRAGRNTSNSRDANLGGDASNSRDTRHVGNISMQQKRRRQKPRILLTTVGTLGTSKAAKTTSTA
jgi:hypothetical protein